MASLKAVMFDIGGVVLHSPILVIREYEKEKGLPPDYINLLITALGHEGSWQKFERGELELRPFYRLFGEEMSDVVKGNATYIQYCRRKGVLCPLLPEVGKLHVDGRDLFGRMMHGSQEYDPLILSCIKSLRELGKWGIIALTNNYTAPYATLAASASSDPWAASELEFLNWKDGPAPTELTDLFDDFVDSSMAGCRKPEPEFYLLACRRNGLRPDQVIFLDDIGLNLKAAAKLGMRTIHVSIGESEKAIRQLESALGVELLQHRTSKL